MNLSRNRKLGIAGLIVAALVAVAVPFVFLHGTSPSGSGTNPTTTGGNNNNNNGQNAGRNPTTTTTTTNPSGGGSGNGDSGSHGGSTGDNHGNSGGNGSTGSCHETKSHDDDSDPQSSGNNSHNGNAYGYLKNKLDTTVALVKSMGVHDPAYHLHHDTDTDNDATHGPHNIVHDPTGHDSSCSSGDEDHDQD